MRDRPCATSVYCPDRVCTPVIVLNMIDQMPEKKITNTVEVKPTPNHRIASGIQAMPGIG